MNIKEVCPCGAATELELGDSAYSFVQAKELLADWRAFHKHEVSAEAGAPEFVEQPMIHESSSSHERSWVIGEELGLIQ